MKLIKNLPKKLFNYKRSPSISKFNDPSFSSETTFSSDSNHADLQNLNKGGVSTPTSVLPTLSYEISADVYSDLVQAFRMIDSDGDGKIRKEELEAILSRVGGGEPPSVEEVRLMLSEVDRDGDGCISLEEFGSISSAFGPPTGYSELRDAFDFFDADHDGKITAEELFNVFRTIGDEQCTLEDCRRMIGGVDRNGDGFVCFEDFSLMMERQR